jgi:hypothetical protein
MAEELTARALSRLGAGVAAPPGGAVRILAVNTDARAFAGVAELVVELPVVGSGGGRRTPPEHLDVPLPFVAADTNLAGVAGAAGPLPFQVLGDEPTTLHLTSRFEPPWTVRGRRLRIALPVETPALGAATYDLRFGESPAAAPVQPVRAGEGWLDNGRVRVSLDADGTFELREQETGRALSGCATLLDEGDVGDEYTFCPPPRDRAVDNGQASVLRTRLLPAGPLRAVMEVAVQLTVPAEAGADRQARAEETVPLGVLLRLALDAGSTRVAVEAEVENRARDHRLRILFPTGAAGVRTARADSAFAVVERPARRQAPAEIRREEPVSAAPMLSFVDAGDERAGVTAFADGLCEYEVIERHGQSWLALTLLRCVGDLSREDLSTRRGGAGPSLPTPGAQCLGRHVFRIGVTPRSAPPPEAALFAAARAFLAPPRAVVATGVPGAPAARGRVLQAEADDLVLSALTRALGRDSLVLRVFNPGGRQARGRFGLAAGMDGAFRLDFLERRLGAVPLEGGAAALTVRPHGIETLELVPRRQRP